jgi:hypothetical protein
MSINVPSFRVRAKWRTPLAAALIAGLGVTTVSLQAAGNDSGGTSPRLAGGDCDLGATGAKSVAAGGPAVEASAVRICGEPDRGDLSGTAEALGAAIKAEAANSAIYAHARMPELLSLRLMAARTEIDSSLPTANRLQKLARIKRQIVALESEISVTGQAN